MPAAKSPPNIDRALIPDMRKRTPLAHQLDLFYRLAVRMVLAGPEAAPVIQKSGDRRQQLEAVLMVPHACWVNLDEISLEIGPLAEAATTRLAPALWDAPPGQIDKVFADLAGLLADIDGYYVRLEALHWDAKYDPVGRKFQPHDPLLTQEAGTWHFQYDRTGRWLRPDQESQKVGYGGADWKRNAELIRDIKTAIEKFAMWPPEAAPLLTVLSTELHILETSPPWSATEPALKRLHLHNSTRRPYAEFNDDVASVGAYARMLAAKQVSLTFALVSAAVAGRFAPNLKVDQARVGAGLRAISDVFGYSDPTGTSPMVEEQMTKLAASITERWPALKDQFTTVQNCLNDRKHDEWAAALQATGDAIAKRVTFSETDRLGTVQRAWDRWREAILKAGEYVPSLDSVLCAAAGVGPDRQLRGLARRLLLTEWSTLYYRAAVHTSIDDLRFAPPWLGAMAATILSPSLASGDTPGVVAIFPGILSDEEIHTIGQIFAEVPRDVTRLSGLVVYGSTPVTTWRVSAEYAAVAWTPEQASQALERLRASPARGPLGTAMNHVFIESNVAEQVATAIVDLVKAPEPDSVRPSVTAFAFDRTAAKPVWADRLITQPENVDALMRTAEARPVENVGALPAQVKSLWDSKARLRGTLEESPPGVRGSLEVELSIDEAELTLVWMFDGKRRLAWLSFANGLLASTGIVTRRFSLLWDGVTLRAEQQAAYVLRFDNFIGRLVARFIDELSFELKEETRGWAVDLTRRRPRGTMPDRRMRMHLFSATNVPTSNAPVPS
jgi:hypothetical protein